jgi:hypothetical protein
MEIFVDERLGENGNPVGIFWSVVWIVLGLNKTRKLFVVVSMKGKVEIRVVLSV